MEPKKGIGFQPFTQQGSADPAKCLSDSSDPSSDQHLPDAGEGFLSCVQLEELFTTQKEEFTVRNLHLLVDFVTCEQKPYAYKCEPRHTKK